MKTNDQSVANELKSLGLTRLNNSHGIDDGIPDELIIIQQCPIGYLRHQNTSICIIMSNPETIPEINPDTKPETTSPNVSSDPKPRLVAAFVPI